MPLFKAEHIVKRYATHTALNDVSLEIPEGVIFGMLGPNGAGKTTMIRIINQIIGPDEGKLYFNGEPLEPKHVSQIGYLPEERGLYKKMKVGEQAVYLAQLKGLSKTDARNRLKYWFEKFELAGWWNKKVEELSKGMQQKVQFIVTILHEPRLLIFDEPFSGFDPINANLIKSEILELKKKGATIIFSTHRMESVEELCDHIALINRSQKILDGSVRDIRKRFRTNTYEVGFSGHYDLVKSTLSAKAEIIGERQDADDVYFTLRLPAGMSSNDLLKQVMGQAEVHHFNEIIPSMNDIFIRSVQGKNPLHE